VEVFEMAQINAIKADPHAEQSLTRRLTRANAAAPAARRLQAASLNYPGLVGFPQLEESQQSIGRVHACRAYQRGFQQERDRLRRANRDLGETAAFIAASLTTVTAVEAVINIAIDKIGLSRAILQTAFNVYVAVFALILLWGAIRARIALRKRAQAERDLDEAKKGIFEFCPEDQWPRFEE
jgi:hypothetical protein